MKAWISIFVAMGLALSALGEDGGTPILGAGDAVKCTAKDSGPLYSLDFLMTSSGDDRDVTPVTSWEQSRDRILAELEKFQDLKRSFAEFLRYVDNRTPEVDFRLERIWEGSPTPLVHVSDEKVTRVLSRWCVKPESNGTVPLLQVVVREPRAGQRTIYYEYDTDAYERLRKEAPLQFSFVMVHAWLRDLTDDVSVIRRTNRFLHSRALEKYAASDLRVALRHIGLSLRQATFKPVCARTPEIKSAIEEALHHPCEEIDEDRVSRLDRVVVVGKHLKRVENGDFSGMPKLQQVHLENNDLEYLPEDIFAGLFDLWVVNVSGNRLTELPTRLFADSPSLRVVNISQNRIKSLPEGLFARLEQKGAEDAMNFLAIGNPLEKFPADFLTHKYGLVDVRGTALSEDWKKTLKLAVPDIIWNLQL